MKPIVVYNKILPFKGFAAITLFPFIFVREEYEPAEWRTINHESIHLRQQLEMLIIPFFLWYVIEWIVRLIQYKDVKEAYRNISFEREAYDNEWDVEYLDFDRNAFDFLKYLKKD